MAKRSKNLAATHIPILVALSKLVTVNKVIEFGAGLYSTPLFLNRSVFPSLQVLFSYENNRLWINKIKRSFKDRRLRLVEVDGPMYSAVVRKIDFSSFDIIFIDDSVTIADRVKTIEAVAQNFNTKGIAVIHDYERLANRKAAERFKHRFRFTAFNPNTGLGWNDCGIRLNLLCRLNVLIKRSALEIEPDDVKEWMRVIEGFIPIEGPSIGIHIPDSPKKRT